MLSILTSLSAAVLPCSGLGYGMSLFVTAVPFDGDKSCPFGSYQRYVSARPVIGARKHSDHRLTSVIAPVSGPKPR